EVLVGEHHHRVVAVTRHRRLADGAARAVGTVADDVVPDGLGAVLGDGKRNALRAAAEAVAALDEVRRGGDALGGLVDALRHGRAAARRIHVHEIARIGPEHGLVAFGEDVLVLRHVGGRDAIEGLVVGEGGGGTPAGD